jgi:hypothetical protein
VRLPHVLTSLQPGEHGPVDDALLNLGLKRTTVLTTPRFITVPFLVRGAPVITTMHARLWVLKNRCTPELREARAFSHLTESSGIPESTRL